MCAWPARGGRKNDEKNHYVLLCFNEFEVGIVTIPLVLCVFLNFGPFLARSQIQKVFVLLSKCCVLGPPKVPQREDPGGSPGGRFGTSNSCQTIVFTVHLAPVAPKSL